MSSAAPLHSAPTVDDTSSLGDPVHEERRWLVWAGSPAVIAAVFLGIALATSKAWILTFAFLAVIAGIVAVVMLAFASDTNGRLVEPSAADLSH